MTNGTRKQGFEVWSSQFVIWETICCLVDSLCEQQWVELLRTAPAWVRDCLGGLATAHHL